MVPMHTDHRFAVVLSLQSCWGRQPQQEVTAAARPSQRQSHQQQVACW